MQFNRPVSQKMIQFKEFSPKALDFIKNSTARLNIAHGSVRSSKTVNCTVRWLIFLATGPRGDLFMVGKTIATLQRNVLNDIRDLVGESNFHWVNRQQGELLLYGRRVYCVGANNEDSETKIRGATIAGVYCDEANLYPEGFFAQLMARMSIEGACAFCNCNPDSPYHWFYTGYIMNDAIKNKKVWHFTMDDNPNLNEEYKLSLSQMYHGVFKKRYIDGLWCVAEGMIYDMFSTETHVKRIPILTPKNRVEFEMGLKPGEKLDPVTAFFASCDYGTSSVMSWSLFAAMSSGKVYKRAEYYYNAEKEFVQKTDGEFLIAFNEWIASYPEVAACSGLYMVYCDPSAVSWKLELQRAGYRVYNADNDVLNGIRIVGNLLAQGRYFIDPSCENTIREYASYSWDAAAQRMGIDRPLKFNDHACDSDRYGLYTYTKSSLTGVY